MCWFIDWKVTISLQEYSINDFVSTFSKKQAKIFETVLVKLFFFSQCFYVPKCRKDHSAMQALVLNISERLKVQQQVHCYSDPAEQQDSAILTRLYGRAAILSSLLWPTCTLVIGVLIVAMVKLTQYLSILCERISRIKRWARTAIEFWDGSMNKENGMKESDNSLTTMFLTGLVTLRLHLPHTPWRAA